MDEMLPISTETSFPDQKSLFDLITDHDDRIDDLFWIMLEIDLGGVAREAQQKQLYQKVDAISESFVNIVRYYGDTEGYGTDVFTQMVAALIISDDVRRVQKLNSMFPRLELEPAFNSDPVLLEQDLKLQLADIAAANRGRLTLQDYFEVFEEAYVDFVSKDLSKFIRQSQ